MPHSEAADASRRGSDWEELSWLGYVWCGDFIEDRKDSCCH